MGKYELILRQLLNKKIFLLTILQISLYIVFVLMFPKQWVVLLLFSILSILGNTVMITVHTKKKVTKTYCNYSLDYSLLIANKTLPYIKQGLNEQTALIISKIIKKISDADAVAITDRKNVLAFVGEGCEHHPIGEPFVTQATYDAIQTGKANIIDSKEGFNCKKKNCHCPLESAVIVPLLNRNKVVGTLKLYQTHKGDISNSLIKLAIGIAQILSMQFELAELDRQTRLATEAQLDALQAQINPHFLFNALNTINMYIIQKPEYARELLIRFSTFLRYLIGNNGRFISLEEELKYIDDYVVIEKARYGSKLDVEYVISEETKKKSIPFLSIQPLVHNAIQHGLLPKEGSGKVIISSYYDNDAIVISVEDDGIGIDSESLHKVFDPSFGSGCGVGIPNVNERLKILFGEENALKIESVYGKGTKVWFKVPVNTLKDE